MLTPARIDDLIAQRLSDAEAVAVLEQLTPERVTAEQLALIIARLEQTVIADFPKLDFPVMDCCGSGGSGYSHYNTSSTVAFVLAAGGVPVVKFGNRAITSKSGSFDFLERIGIPVELPTEVAADILDETGLIFLFAPQWYPGLANLKRLRQMLSVPTVFNIVGPLLNPAKPALRLIGMMDPNAQKLVAQYLADHTATQHAWVVRSDANAPFGKDELDLAPTSRVIVVTPEEAGIQDVRSPRQIDLDKAPVGPYDAAFNAQLFEEIVEGRDDVSPIYHHVCLNAGAGFLIADKVDSLEDGVQLAEELLSAGVVRDTWIACRRVYAAYAG